MAVDSANPVPGLEQTQMEKWANRFSKIFLEKTRLKSQDGTYSFRTVADTTLSAAPSSGDGTVSITSATGYPTGGGLILIDGIPHIYDSISSLTVTLNSSYALDRDYSSGDTVQLGYVIPTDMAKARSLFVSGVGHRYAKYGVSEKIPARFFSIFSTYLLLPPAPSADQDSVLHYYKKATNTLSSSSAMEIYQMWDAYVIYRLAARGHRVMYDSDKAIEYEQLAREMLDGARQQIATEDDSVHRAFVPGW